jgi:hypothetical protein
VAAVKSVETYALSKTGKFLLPTPVEFLHGYTKWALTTANLRVGTVESYLSSLKLLHTLSKLSTNHFEDDYLKVLLQGGKNQEIYRPNTNHRVSMSLPLLKVLGHQISTLEWGEWAKQTVWTACTVAFFGAFRMGELLPARESGNCLEDTLVWGDVKLSQDHLLIRIECPKTKTPGGEHVDLFEFPGQGV